MFIMKNNDKIQSGDVRRGCDAIVNMGGGSRESHNLESSVPLYYLLQKIPE